MPQQAWKATDFQGLAPGIDPRRSDKFFALSGQNYVFDSIGPRSIYGNRFLTPIQVALAAHSQGFRLRIKEDNIDRAFTLLGDGIYEWSEVRGNWQLIFETPDTTIQPHAWTRGYINDKQYFCHPLVGIVVYDLVLGGAYKHPSPPSTKPIAITDNNGRLIIIDEDFYYWSSQSDGLDFTPAIAGAGFQKISDRVSGRPIAVTSYTAGTLVWCSGGVMRSEFTGDEAVYRHRALMTNIRPINSFCTTQIDDDTVVILDERGLFQSKGDVPTPYTPVFNEFLIRYIQEYNLNEGQNIRIEYDDLQRFLYVSVSFSFTSPIYESCFVLYPPLDKWGQFNEAHYGIIPLKIDSGSRADDYYGFVDAASRVRYWDKIGSREVFPVDPTLNSQSPAVQKPGLLDLDTGVNLLSSSAETSSFASDGTTGHAGFYPWDGGANATPTIGGLAAIIRLGLLRFDLNDAMDQMTEVINLIIGNAMLGETDTVAANYDITPIQPTADLGLEDINAVNFKLRVISTVDGKSEYQSAIPELYRFDKGARHYSCSTSGIWHILELAATDVGEAFWIQSIDLTAAYAGKFS